MGAKWSRSSVLFAFLAVSLICSATAQVTKVNLDNGMTVLVKEVPQVPVVALVAYIKVGSVNDPDSLAGMSHFLEHMLFKGTEKVGPGAMAREVESLGGYTNAATGYERTSHIVMVPSRHFHTGLELQADALMHSTLSSEELNTEAKVVLEEVNMSLDEPEDFVWYELLGLAFRQHGYARPILGYSETVSRIKRENMLHHYKNYYKPNNMVLAVVGDVDTEEAIAKAKEVYRGTRKGEVERLEPEPEPAQKGFRFASYSGHLERTYLQLGFHIPDELHADSYALEILSILLSRGRSSRLYQKVREEKGLVSDIWTYCFSGGYPGLFIVGATLDSEYLEAAEVAILEELERLKTELVSREELKKARSKVEALYETRRETVQGQAYNIGYYETMGDHRLADLYILSLYKVTEEDIRRVADKYLDLDNCTLVFYRPEEETVPQAGMPAEEVHSFLKTRLPEEAVAEAPVGREAEKVILRNGITVLVKENPSVPLVSIGAYFRGGVRFEDKENNGITNFTQRVLVKGTDTRSQAELAEELESLGGSLSPVVQEDYFGLNLSILSRSLEGGLGILADLLKKPSFRNEEVEKEREEILREIRGRRDNLFRYTWDLFKTALFKVHPYKRPLLGEKGSVSGLGRGDLVNWYRRWSSPDNLIISVVGDVDFDLVVDAIEESLAGLGARTVKTPQVPQEVKPRQKTILTEQLEKEQTHIILGFLGPRVADQDYYPFTVLDAVLGGMRGRLWDHLREKRGLGYVVDSWLDSGVDPGSFAVYIGTSPDQEETAIEGILGELRRLKEEGVTEEELAGAKRYLIGIHDIRLQRNSSQVRSYAENEIFGLGYQAVEAFADYIESVTRDDVNRVIDRYFDLENYSLAVVRGKSG